MTIVLIESPTHLASGINAISIPRLVALLLVVIGPLQLLSCEGKIN
jgi:hypothetical protein